jgi:hypothetical protein
MVTTSQNKTVAEHLLERIFLNDKEQEGRFEVLKQKGKANTSIHVLYHPRSKRPEEHFFQYFT